MKKMKKDAIIRKSRLRRVWLGACFGLILATGAWAENGSDGMILGPLDSGPQFLVIEGDSNLKGWTVEGSIIRGRIELARPAGEAKNGLLSHFIADTPGVEVSIPVLSLEGNGGRLMNRIMRSALKADEHPNIVFKLDSLQSQRKTIAKNESEPEPAIRENLEVDAKGALTAAGQTRPVLVRATLKKTEKELKIEGRAELRLTDFGIDPPRAMFGALRTHDEIAVRFVWSLAPVAP